MRVYLQRVRLNQGGYDRHGNYWGVGAPLYAYEFAGDGETRHIRAHSREDAKIRIFKLFPQLEPTMKFAR